MAMQAVTTGRAPVARLHEIADCLTLALDASESPRGYTIAEREARSYTRAALRQIERLIEGVKQ